MFISGKYAYVASVYTDTISIVDISNPNVPNPHGKSNTGGTGGALLDFPYTVYVSGNYAYVGSLFSSSLEIVDISNPAKPTHAGSITDGTGGALLGAPSASIYVSGKYAYIISDGTGSFRNSRYF